MRPILYQEVVLILEGQAVALARTLDRQPEKGELIQQLEVQLDSWEVGGKGTKTVYSVLEGCGALLRLALEASPDEPRVDLPKEIHLDSKLLSTRIRSSANLTFYFRAPASHQT